MSEGLPWWLGTVSSALVSPSLSEPPPPSLSVTLLLLVILSHTRGQLYITVAACSGHSQRKHWCGTFSDHEGALWCSSLMDSNMRSLLHCERKCQRRVSPALASCLHVFFPSQHHNWREKDQSKPRGDNHTLTKEIIMFCSRAGQLRVSDTNVTLLSAPLPYMLRSCAPLLIALPWICDSQMVQNPFIKPPEIMAALYP